MKNNFHYKKSKKFFLILKILIIRKAIKEFKPISIDAESEELTSILNEIEVLKKLTSKSEYVINYLDSFSIEINNYKIYHLVTDFYEVILFKYSNLFLGVNNNFSKDNFGRIFI